MHKRPQPSPSSIQSLLICMIFLLITAVAWATPMIELQPIVTGLVNPVAITHAGDGSGRLFITLKGGKVVIYDGAEVLVEPFVDSYFSLAKFF